MAPLPPRVTFVVGTSLLGAALSLGCTAKPAEDKKEATEKKAPEPEPDHVNTGPKPEPEPRTVNEGPEPPPEPINVNEGPKPEPEPAPEQLKVNPGPTDEKPTVVEPVEEKRVNTRPNDI